MGIYMSTAIKSVVVVGGGTAGWITASLLKKMLGHLIDITLVESEDIGRVGVGEATIPPIRLLNSVLGIDESEFLRETNATIKLAIKFENWRVQGESYFHTFGAAGKTMGFCPFHHLWLRAKAEGNESNLWDYDLNYLCATANKFSPLNERDPALEMLYAYHFDASLYAGFLRRYSEKLGVKRLEGLIENIALDSDAGNVTELFLSNGFSIKGDFFIDCSGLHSLLIQRKLGTGYEDWSHWLPCDRAVAVPSGRLDVTLPYTRSIAHKAGWQWRIPLQHRNGNGLVYSSRYWSDDEAAHALLSNLDTPAQADPKLIKFRTGRCLQQWNRNVVAIGLSSGFLEPLESTSIHLIQSAVVRLLKFFPHTGINSADINEYNRQSKIEFEQIRDFIILHYHLNQRDDSQFWRDLRNMRVPESLQRKIDLFHASARVFREQDDLFTEASWVQVMLGQGIAPQDYHPIANSLPTDKLFESLRSMKNFKMTPVEKMPSHDEFLQRICRV